MKIMITGATGTVGSALTQVLRGQGHAPTLLASNANSAASLAASGLEVRRADYLDRHSLEAAFAGIDRLFLLLPLVESKAQMAELALSAAKAAGVQFVLRSSGIGADPSSPYALMALQGEIDRMVAGSGIAHALLRPSSFMQNYITYHRHAIRSGGLYLPDGEGRTSLIDCRDIAAVAATVLMNPADHYDARHELTGSEALDHTDALNVINARCTLKSRYYQVTEASARETMIGHGVPAWNVEMLLSLAQYTRDGHSARCTDSVHAILGRDPVLFSRFVADHADVWRP